MTIPVSTKELNVSLRNADEWLEYFGIDKDDILDPDGWDRKNWEVSWNEEITQKEFSRRLGKCTVNVTDEIEKALGMR